MMKFGILEVAHLKNGMDFIPKAGIFVMKPKENIIFMAFGNLDGAIGPSYFYLIKTSAPETAIYVY